MGFVVTGVDRDVTTVQPSAGAHCDGREIDLQAGDPTELPES